MTGVFLYAFELIELNGHDLWRDFLGSDVCVIVWPVGEFSWTAAIWRNSAARSKRFSAIQLWRRAASSPMLRRATNIPQVWSLECLVARSQWKDKHIS